MTNIFSSERVKGKRIIYTPSPFARKNLIYLQEIGSSEYLEPYESRRGMLDSYLFFYIKNGQGELNYQDVLYVLNEGDCVLVNCRNEYVISSDDYLWSLDWIHFDGIYMRAIYEKYIERCGGPCFKASDKDVLELIYEKLFQVINSQEYVKDMLIMTLLTELLTELMRQCWGNEAVKGISASQKRWEPVKEYLEDNYYKSVKLEELAETFSINKFYLTRKFKEIYGETINEYLTNLRITKAKELLRFSDMTISEISDCVGYSEVAYFTRVFKRNEGMAPSIFKKRWNSNSKSI